MPRLITRSYTSSYACYKTNSTTGFPFRLHVELLLSTLKFFVFVKSDQAGRSSVESMSTALHTASSPALVVRDEKQDYQLTVEAFEA